MENERNVAEDESILASIDESSTDDDIDDVYITTNTLEEIQYGNHVHQDINTRDARLKVCDRIKQAQSDWKGENINKEDDKMFT